MAVQTLVVDATGVGAGLTSMLKAPCRPCKAIHFNVSSKITAWLDFLGLVDSGRWQEDLYPPDAPGASPLAAEFFASGRLPIRGAAGPNNA